MSIMVTGASGLIGSRIARKLVERGEQVVCFDLAPPGPALRPFVDAVTLVRGDVTQTAHLMEAVKTHEVTRVIHMAALLPPASEERPSDGFFVNIQGANNLFEVARWAGIERVVYASSIACYGAQESHGERPLNEDDVPNPVNVYGMTKVVNDFSAATYTERFGLDLRGIRICTVFGHGRTTGVTGLVGGLLMSDPAVGKPVHLPVRADDKSSLIYVEDAAEIFIRTALSDTLRHPVYITGGHVATVGEVADLVRSYLPDAVITTGDRTTPHVHLVDNSRMLGDIGYEMPPLRDRVLDHINEARAEAGLEPVSGPR